MTRPRPHDDAAAAIPDFDTMHTTGHTPPHDEIRFDHARVAAAARLLLGVRRGAPLLQAFPDEARPASEAEAYAVQDTVMQALGPSDTFKVGAKGGIGPRTSAPIPHDLVVPGPARFRFAQFGSCTMEVELAYRLGRDLPPREEPYSEMEVRDAIDAVVPTIEIADSRFHDYRAVDRFSQLADNQNCGALILGETIADWRGIDPRAVVARLVFDDVEIACTTGGHKMGDPFPLVHWFVNQQSTRGRVTRAGSLLTTGSLVGSIPLLQPASVIATIDGIGRIETVLA